MGPNIVGKNSETYRFLCIPQVLFNMGPRNNTTLRKKTTGCIISLSSRKKMNKNPRTENVNMKKSELRFADVTLF